MTRTLVLAATASLALAACSDTATVASGSAPTAESTATAAVMDTKTKAVLVYADWCGSCKALDPKVSPIQEAGVPGVEFVTLDYTDRDEADFYAQARAAGVEDAVRAKLDGTVKTGLLLLVDVDDDTVLDTVTKADSEADIRAKIDAALAQS